MTDHFPRIQIGLGFYCHLGKLRSRYESRGDKGSKRCRLRTHGDILIKLDGKQNWELFLRIELQIQQVDSNSSGCGMQMKTVLKVPHLLRPGTDHTPRLAFRLLPPSSAIIGYVTEGALICQRMLPALPKGLYTNKTESNTGPKHARKQEMHPPRVKKKKKKKKLFPSRFESFICTGVSSVGGYLRNA